MHFGPFYFRITVDNLTRLQCSRWMTLRCTQLERIIMRPDLLFEYKKLVRVRQTEHYQTIKNHSR